MKKLFSSFFTDLFAVFIITIPSFISILNSKYFSMHDDQHIARLYLLVTGIKQGYVFPRWVDMLGFGFGYPLFNFYPPLIYYVSSVFYFLGFSLIWSIKLMIICGFVLSAIGSYLFIKKLVGRVSALVGATVYVYFLYHSVTVYVRGAFAEFFTIAILPFIFLSILNLSQKINWKNSILFSILFALLILTHPLIAFPSIIFIGLFYIYLFLQNSSKVRFVLFSFLGGVLSLGLSAFFWLPSIMERKYTLIDNILTKELASYKDHFVYLFQLWYSPWGYGGSTKGLADGMTYQLGKVPIMFVVISALLGTLYFIKRKKIDNILKIYLFILFSLLLSFFMMTEYSSFIWDRISFLWYIQFPWRFLTFVNFFISVIAGFSIYFLKDFLKIFNKKIYHLVFGLFVMAAISVTVYKYYPYFKPQKFISTNDRQRTSFKEIAWRISSTSYEFVPKDVKTKKTGLGTTTLAINEREISQIPGLIKRGVGKIKVVKNTFRIKEFNVIAKTPVEFQLNTYNFPGWQASLDGKIIKINNDNDLKLITVFVPEGNHKLLFEFKNTLVRTIGNFVSFLSIIIIVMFLFINFAIISKRKLS